MQTFADDSGDIKFKQLTIKQGLSQSRISDIIQDSRGFIWVATEDGLNRYDGYRFEIFSFDPDDANSLSNQSITALAPDDSGNVWVGTSLGGLNKYIAAEQHFISYQYNPADSTSLPDNLITHVSKDKKGNLWMIFGWSIIGYFDTKAGVCTVYDLFDVGRADRNVPQVFFAEEDRHGTIWFGTINGLYRYYPDTKTTKVYRADRNDPNSLSHSRVNSMFEDSRGQLWFGTENGLNLFKVQNETFTNFRIKNSTAKQSIANVSAILEDRNGIMWVGTWGNGLYRIDRHSEEVAHYTSDPDDLTSLSENFISVLMEDRTGEIWVGTDLNGVSKIDRAATRFRPVSVENSGLTHNQIRAFWVEENGIIWLGADGGGLIRFNRRTSQWKVYNHQPGNTNSLSSDGIRALYRDDKGILWIGTRQGLNRFDPVKESFEHIYIRPENQAALENMIGYQIIETPAYPGVLWFGSSAAGLCSYDKRRKELKTYIIDTSEVQPSVKNFVKALAYDRKNPARLFVGANDGFTIFDIETESFKIYRSKKKNFARRSSDNIMCFHQDDAGNLWIATYGGGIMRFNLEMEETKIYTVQNSDLPSNGVYSIIPDNNGFFWLSSNRGISRFDPRTESFKNYTVDDGLQNDEFNGGAYFKSFSGEMFFGGLNGYNSFYPESITDNNIEPEVMITGFKIFNQKITPGEDSPLKKNILLTDFIELDHWQNDIAFEFVGLHFFRPENNKYAYILENYDPGWRQVEAIRNAVYTNLDPGQYMFKVRAANSDGVWNNKGKSISITIHPPWWKTNWAYAGYILLAAIFVIGVDRFQRYRLIQREQQRTQIREAELRAHAAEAENKRKTQELEEARKLQLALLPEKLPELPNLQIAVYMKTATEVGGDYYDFYISADGTLNVAMGDATGHGMQAGTVVTLMKGLFSADAGRMEISDFFTQSNEALKNLRIGRMMMAFTLIKISDNNLVLSSAGMPPAYIYRPANLKVDEILHESMPLGALKSFDYQVYRSKLADGDTILLFSDGLPELKNPDGVQFDYQRVEQIFKEEADKPAQKIIDRLVDAGEMWRKNQPPDDDITMMVIKAK
jgi:ligand-binding sensor domain-containing protein/serine phosphatase RsbU (regulator of sigma subunit)